MAKRERGFGCRCAAKPVAAKPVAAKPLVEEAPATEETREGGASEGAPKRRRAWIAEEEDAFIDAVSKHGMAWQQVARNPLLKQRCQFSPYALADKYKSIMAGKNEGLKERLRRACGAHVVATEVVTEVALTLTLTLTLTPQP